MPNSVLDAIRAGIQDYEPDPVTAEEFESTRAVAGSWEKIEELRRRVELGLPLWHPHDNVNRDDGNDEAPLTSSIPVQRRTTKLRNEG